MTEETYYEYPGEKEEHTESSHGMGCWIVGTITMLIVGVLVVIGLFLPPFNLGERIFRNSYAMLNAQNNAAAVIRASTGQPEFTLSVNPDTPGIEFGVKLESQATRPNTLPNYLNPISPIYGIDYTGTPPETTFLTIDLETSPANPASIDLYGWYGDEWRFLPAQTSGSRMNAQVDELPEWLTIVTTQASAPLIFTTLGFGQTLTQDVSSLSTIITPVGMQPALPSTPQRTLTGNLAGGFAVGADYRVMPLIRNFNDPRAVDTETVIGIIGNDSLRAEHIQQITTFALAGGYSGVVIDYRDIPAEQRDYFSRFITDLATSLDSNNLLLGVVVPSPDQLGEIWDTAGYDWQVIGSASDYLKIEIPRDPDLFATNGYIDSMLMWAVGQVSRYKLVIALSALSVRESSNTFTSVTYDDALAALGNVDIEATRSDIGTIQPGAEIRIGLDGFDALPGIDEIVRTPFVDYFNEDDTRIARMWLTTSDALRYRMDRLQVYGVTGVAFNDLLNAGVAGGVMEEILNYSIQLPSTPHDGLFLLSWRIESAEGLVTEFTTGFNEEIVVTLNAPDGNYAVNVAVGDGQISSNREGAAVALYAATPTPTPLPTATPTATPTPTATLEPIIPTQAAVANAPVPGAIVNRGPGSIAVGSFEYGGHVTGAASERAINAARNSGMTWMKVQIRYTVGTGTQYAAEQIQAAHGNGFKILLGIVGAPAELAAGGGDYIRQYAAFVGEVAGLGPDAIEVWNEPNLDREWPTGQISGGNYTALLGAAYQAIKARNPGVMVIAGAPAPTGAEAVFPGQVVNDDNFIIQMMQAGAINYMDCMGMHYNEGLVTGSAVSGDPRDNYYTRYLPTLLSRYWNLVNGQVPICITELGYLTPEGYPPLTSFFGWAQNMTVARQSAYLADAAAYASQSGQVRMMIVWNVDFTRYDSDPMAGYAIIRPDGSCPACSALAGAR